jgi:hypothetical protein
MKDTSPRGKNPIELADEAFQLLRLRPASTLTSYYIGTAPFVFGFLFFWSDMSRGAFADMRLAAESIGLTLLFFWMKMWQVVFARQLRAEVSGHAAPPLKPGRLCRIAVTQGILQPSGLFLIPIALALLFPIGWVYAFYQNVTVLGASDKYSFKDVYRKAIRQSALWPLQNNYLVFLFKGFGLFVLLNIVSAVAFLPHLLSIFLGIQTAFVQSSWAFLNTTFFATVFGLAYLCLDPLVKAVYVLRCFYGESRQSGEDLKSELKLYSGGVQRAAALLMGSAVLFGDFSKAEAVEFDGKSASFESSVSVNRPLTPALSTGGGGEEPNIGYCVVEAASVLLGAVAPGVAEAPQTASAMKSATVNAGELDETIEQVLNRPEYTWRLPREKVSEEKKKGPIASFVESAFKTVIDWVKKVRGAFNRLIKWLTRGQTPGGAGPASGLSSLFGARGLIAVLLLVIAALLGLLLLRLWRNREAAAAQVTAEAVVPVPDLDDENIAADQLPEDGWMTLARDLLSRGELRLALRAFYLASLAHLAQRNLITIARFKSNRDYERELSRRAHALPQLMSTFTENVSIFDRIWYGMHDVNDTLLDHFRNNVERINAA